MYATTNFPAPVLEKIVLRKKRFLFCKIKNQTKKLFVSAMRDVFEKKKRAGANITWITRTVKFANFFHLLRLIQFLLISCLMANYDQEKIQCSLHYRWKKHPSSSNSKDLNFVPKPITGSKLYKNNIVLSRRAYRDSLADKRRTPILQQCDEICAFLGGEIAASPGYVCRSREKSRLLALEN